MLYKFLLKWIIVFLKSRTIIQSLQTQIKFSLIYNSIVVLTSVFIRETWLQTAFPTVAVSPHQIQTYISQLTYMKCKLYTTKDFIHSIDVIKRKQWFNSWGR